VPLPKHRYRVTLNWQGAIHVFYTMANTPLVAKMAILSRFSHDIDRSITTLNNYFDGRRDNFKIEEVTKDDLTRTT
jgi:uncharacterized protein (DUF1810 family)